MPAPAMSQAAIAKRDQLTKSTKLSLKVDAQVFLRIAKHAKQTYPNSASGSLLGLDDGKNVRVTNCFSYKTKQDGEPSDNFLEYQYGVLKAIEEVRGDANAVGWYESTHHGIFLTEAFIENQYQFQKEVPSAVVLVYDPAKQKVGTCGFKAYRLTDAAMHKKLTMNIDEDTDPFADFPSSDLLEEVPVYVHCSPLVETLMLQMDAQSTAAFDLDSAGPAMDRNLQLLLESLEELSQQQREMQMYERLTRAQKEKQQKTQRVPKAVDTLNLTKQIQAHCATVDEHAQDTFAKLFLLDAKISKDPKDGNSKVRTVMEKLQN
ncbi:unnamed protein product [Amoebophrya sp. A120]|nr:unnamed protein product [Amoebophrya sp. A120]|eukprot:GSA120T00000853001.1